MKVFQCTILITSLVKELTAYAPISSNGFISTRSKFQSQMMKNIHGGPAFSFEGRSVRSMSSLSARKIPNEETERSISSLSAKKSPNEETEDGSGGVRQLLGIKGASETTDIWKIRLQLTKPVVSYYFFSIMIPTSSALSRLFLALLFLTFFILILFRWNVHFISRPIFRLGFHLYGV